MLSRIHFRVIPRDKQDWPWVDNGWSWLVGTWGFILLFSLVVFMFEIFHNGKLEKNLHADDPQLFFSSPAQAPEVQSYVSVCLLNISTWMLIDVSYLTCPKLNFWFFDANIFFLQSPILVMRIPAFPLLIHNAYGHASLLSFMSFIQSIKKILLTLPAKYTETMTSQNCFHCHHHGPSHHHLSPASPLPLTGCGPHSSQKDPTRHKSHHACHAQNPAVASFRTQWKPWLEWSAKTLQLMNTVQ